MFRLIFSKFHRNFRLFLGTFLAIVVVSMTIVSCLDLISGCVTSSDDGHRFDSCLAVVSASENIAFSHEDDGKIEQEWEKLEQERTFTQEELELLLSVLEGREFVFDYTFALEMSKEGKRHDLPLYGHNYSAVQLSGFILSEGTAPNPDEIVIDSVYSDKYGVETGDVLTVTVKGESKDFRVSGVVKHDNDDIFARQNFVFFNDQQAIEFSDGAYNVGLFFRDEQLEKQLKEQGFDVFTGNNVNGGEFARFKSNFQAPMIVFITMASICLLASLFVLAGTISFSVRHRQREIALLRTIGMSRRQLFAMLVVENVIVGVVGFATGLLLANGFSELLRRLFVEVSVIPQWFSVSRNFTMIAISAIGIVILPVIVALWVSRKAILISPVQAMKEEEVHIAKNIVARTVTGVILTGGAFAVIFATPYYGGLGVGMGFCAVGLFLGASFLFTPLFMRIINGLLSVFTKKMYRSLGNVANANVSRKANKFAVAAISLALMFSLNSVMLLNNFTYIQDNAFNRYALFASAQYYVSGISHYTDVGDCDRLFVKQTQLILFDGRNTTEVAAIATEGDNLLSLKITEGRLPDKKGEIALLDSQTNVATGDTVTTCLPDGTITQLTVVGRYSHKYKYVFESGIPSAVVCLDTVKDHIFDSNGTMYFRTDKGQYEDLSLQLEKLGYNVQQNTIEAYTDNTEFDVQKGATVLMIVISVMLTLIALFNTFAMIMTVRKNEFNCLRIIGANKTQILKMTVIETVIVTITGMTLGFLFSMICVGYYSYCATGVFDFVVNGRWYFSLFGCITACGLIAGFIPSLFTLAKMRRSVRQE